MVETAAHQKNVALHMAIGLKSRSVNQQRTCICAPIDHEKGLLAGYGRHLEIVRIVERRYSMLRPENASRLR